MCLLHNWNIHATFMFNQQIYHICLSLKISVWYYSLIYIFFLFTLSNYFMYVHAAFILWFHCVKINTMSSVLFYSILSYSVLFYSILLCSILFNAWCFCKWKWTLTYCKSKVKANLLFEKRVSKSRPLWDSGTRKCLSDSERLWPPL